MINLDDIRSRWQLVVPFLDERGRRLFAANEALALGFSGVTATALATGIARSTINRGIDAIHTDPEGARGAMIKWAKLNPDMVGKIGMPLFEKNLSPKDLQATIDLTVKYKMISRPLKAQEVISDLTLKG